MGGLKDKKIEPGLAPGLQTLLEKEVSAFCEENDLEVGDVLPKAEEEFVKKLQADPKLDPAETLQAILLGILDSATKDEEGAFEETSDVQISGDALDPYYREVGKYRLLTQEEEAALGEKILAGRREDASEEEKVAAMEARNELINHNLKLVYYTLGTMNLPKRAGISDKDLAQDGALGLARAAEKFDPRLGYRFSTYAIPWIKQAILKSYSEDTIVRVSVSKGKQISEVRRKQRELEEELEREPTSEEISQALPKYEPEEIEDLLSIRGEAEELDAPLDEDEGGTTKGDLTPSEDDPKEGLDEEDEEKETEKSLKFLTPREREVIVAAFGLDGKPERTLEEIGKSMGVTRERVRQIKVRALEKMKQGLKGEK